MVAHAGPAPVPSGAGRRLVAGGVDALLFLLMIAAGLALGWWLPVLLARVGVLGEVPPPVGRDPWMVATTWILMPILWCIYEVAVTADGRGTPGKRLLGIAVRDAATGAVPDLRQAVSRVLGRLACIVSLGLGFLPILGPGRRGLHDYLAGTRVVGRCQTAASVERVES